MLIALWIILIVCLLWLSLTELPAGWDGHSPLPYLIALTPMLWIAFTALGVAGLCMREWGFAACCAAGLIASLMRKTAYWLNNLKSPNTGEAIARKIAERKAREAQSHIQATQGTPRLDNGHDGRFLLCTKRKSPRKRADVLQFLRRCVFLSDAVQHRYRDPPSVCRGGISAHLYKGPDAGAAGKPVIVRC